MSIVCRRYTSVRVPAARPATNHANETLLPTASDLRGHFCPAYRFQMHDVEQNNFKKPYKKLHSLIAKFQTIESAYV